MPNLNFIADIIDSVGAEKVMDRFFSSYDFHAAFTEEAGFNSFLQGYYNELNDKHYGNNPIESDSETSDKTYKSLTFNTILNSQNGIHAISNTVQAHSWQRLGISGEMTRFAYLSPQERIQVIREVNSEIKSLSEESEALKEFGSVDTVKDVDAAISKLEMLSNNYSVYNNVELATSVLSSNGLNDLFCKGLEMTGKFSPESMNVIRDLVNGVHDPIKFVHDVIKWLSPEKEPEADKEIEIDTDIENDNKEQESDFNEFPNDIELQEIDNYDLLNNENELINDDIDTDNDFNDPDNEDEISEEETEFDIDSSETDIYETDIDNTDREDADETADNSELSDDITENEDNGDTEFNTDNKSDEEPENNSVEHNDNNDESDMLKDSTSDNNDREEEADSDTEPALFNEPEYGHDSGIHDEGNYEDSNGAEDYDELSNFSDENEIVPDEYEMDRSETENDFEKNNEFDMDSFDNDISDISDTYEIDMHDNTIESAESEDLLFNDDESKTIDIQETEQFEDVTSHSDGYMDSELQEVAEDMTPDSVEDIIPPEQDINENIFETNDFYEGTENLDLEDIPDPAELDAALDDNAYEFERPEPEADFEMDQDSGDREQVGDNIDFDSMEEMPELDADFERITDTSFEDPTIDKYEPDYEDVGPDSEFNIDALEDAEEIEEAVEAAEGIESLLALL